MLHQLLDTGTEIARLIVLQAQNHPRPSDLAASYEQVAQAMRQTAALAMKLSPAAAPAPPRKPSVATIKLSEPPAPDDDERRRRLARLN